MSGKEILTELFNNNFSVYPYEITVCNDRVDATFDQGTRSFCFLQHRIAEFEQVFFSGFSYKDIYYDPDQNYEFQSRITICPQVVLAAALNQLLENKYNLKDNAQIKIYERSNNWLHDYTSNNVVLRLKATRSL